jgi:hypothetical protein
VTRVFQLLQSKGLVERDGNDLIILNAKHLHDIAEGAQDS